MDGMDVNAPEGLNEVLLWKVGGFVFLLKFSVI